MNAFARSNLAVALLRLTEAEVALGRIGRLTTDEERVRTWEAVGAARWGVKEAMRLIDAATALDDMESVDTLPSPPDSGARRVSG